MIVTRQANKQDINTIVEIHLERFSNFFLTNLGKTFLKVFYKAFLKKPAILLVIEDENAIKGFAAGSLHNKGFFKKLLLNNLLEFCLIGIKIALTNPFALKRIAVNASKSEENNIVYAELLSIATLQNKKGYGKILLEKFQEELIKQNCNLPISLTTDYYDNAKAIDFYKNSGYEMLEIFYSYQNRKMYRFIKKIN